MSRSRRSEVDRRHQSPKFPSMAPISRIVPAFLLAATAGLAEPRSATLYEIGSDPPRLLFTWQGDVQPDTIRGGFYDPEGTLVAADEYVSRDGQFVRYSYERFNIDERASVERQGHRVLFTQNWRGRTRFEEHPHDKNFVAGPAVVPRIRQHWDRLLDGGTVEIRYAVLDQLRPFGFHLREDSSARTPGRVAIEMRAASFLVRFFIDPLRFVLSADGTRLYSITGRTLPVGVEDGEPRSINAEMVFDETPDRSTW